VFSAAPDESMRASKGSSVHNRGEWVRLLLGVAFWMLAVGLVLLWLGDEDRRDVLQAPRAPLAQQ